MKRMWKGAAAALALSFVCSAPAAAYEAFSGPLGLLYSDKSKAFDGYTLVAPLQTNVTYLMDMDGNIINEWTCDTTPFYSELLPNGNLIRHGRLPDAWPAYGGVSGVLQEYDWSGNKVWEYKMFTPGVEVSHHTFEVMPNGNYMLLGWEHKSYDEMVKAGRDVNLPGHSVFKDGMKIDGRMVEGIWPDFVREINRQGETVWEWHVWDHLGKGPDKIDINVFLTPKRSPVTAGPDWTHFNGVSYNPNTDQVALTSRNLGEVYIIDKKTGNIVSRWGNDGTWRVQSAKLLATMLHGMEGMPYIYQGEELGMTNCPMTLDQYRDLESLNLYRERTEAGYPVEDVMESLHAKSRDNARTPMQWDDTPNAGFTTGTPWLMVNPNYKEINAARAVADPDSVFHYYQKLIALRKSHPVFTEGDFTLLEAEHPQLFVYRRQNADRELLVVCNFSDEPAAWTLPDGWDKAERLIGNYPADSSGTLRPWEAMMLERAR